MASLADRCPFLIPVVADSLWVWPVSAYCRRPDAPVKVPARQTLVGVCTTSAHTRCPGFQAASPSAIRPT
jgi:hypothetical protein